MIDIDYTGLLGLGIESQSSGCAIVLSTLHHCIATKIGFWYTQYILLCIALFGCCIFVTFLLVHVLFAYVVNAIEVEVHTHFVCQCSLAHHTMHIG